MSANPDSHNNLSLVGLLHQKSSEKKLNCCVRATWCGAVVPARATVPDPLKEHGAVT